MITVTLTNDQYVMLRLAVLNERERESSLAYNSSWPANGHHESNVRLLDVVGDLLSDAARHRISEVAASR